MFELELAFLVLVGMAFGSFMVSLMAASLRSGR